MVANANGKSDRSGGNQDWLTEWQNDLMNTVHGVMLLAIDEAIQNGECPRDAKKLAVVSAITPVIGWALQSKGRGIESDSHSRELMNKAIEFLSSL